MASVLPDLAVPALLAFRQVTRTWGEGEGQVRALTGVDLDIHRGEFVAITGASGSGKSTAVSILGCLDVPSSGEYLIEGHPVQSLPPDVLAALRNAKFGFVFQSYNLLTRTSALDNVALPLIYAGLGVSAREARALEALSAVGLAARADATPNQLSGGQQQRVAIARALVNQPEVILADEPTGNLDSKTSAEIMQLIKSLNEDRGITVVMVTHDPKSAALARRQLVFRDGQIVSDTERA
ncbi:MAG: ABC transporter ATP-binding protein [Archangium sp.]|nr:ABC transporter ATP-binding protein [Archangium sp.]